MLDKGQEIKERLIRVATNIIVDKADHECIDRAIEEGYLEENSEVNEKSFTIKNIRGIQESIQINLQNELGLNIDDIEQCYIEEFTIVGGL